MRIQDGVARVQFLCLLCRELLSAFRAANVALLPPSLLPVPLPALVVPVHLLTCAQSLFVPGTLLHRQFGVARRRLRFHL